MHTGSFGFFDSGSITRIPDTTLRNVVQHVPSLAFDSLPDDPAQLRAKLPKHALSELPLFLGGTKRLNVPVYTTYGAVEDIFVLDRFRSRDYIVPNLHLINELASFTIETSSGYKLRLFGLGGALILNKLFDTGDGRTTIAGTHGVVWTSLLQIGQLITTARKAYDPTEIRVFVTHPSPAREGLLAQLALVLHADYTISSSPHFLNTASFNSYSAFPDEASYSQLFIVSRHSFFALWETVKPQLLQVLANYPKQLQVIQTAVDVFEAMPKNPDSVTNQFSESFKNLWHFNLTDANTGALVLTIQNGRVASEAFSEGFDFHYRLNNKALQVPTAPTAHFKQQDKQKQEHQQQQNQQQYQKNLSVPTEPSGHARKPSIGNREPPGIWISNAKDGEAAVKQYFAAEDRPLIKSVFIKEVSAAPERQYAKVYFGSAQEAAAALARIDLQAAGKAALIRESSTRPASSLSHGRSGPRGGQRSKTR